MGTRLFPKERFSDISRNGTPKRILYISGNRNLWAQEMKKSRSEKASYIPGNGIF